MVGITKYVSIISHQLVQKMGNLVTQHFPHFALHSPVSSYYQEPQGTLWPSEIMGNVFSDMSRAYSPNLTGTRPRKGCIPWPRESCGPWAWQWLVVTSNTCARCLCKPQGGWASFLPWEYRKNKNQEDSSAEAFYTYFGCEGRDCFLFAIVGTKSPTVLRSCWKKTER